MIENTLERIADALDRIAGAMGQNAPTPMPPPQLNITKAEASKILKSIGHIETEETDPSVVAIEAPKKRGRPTKAVEVISLVEEAVETPKAVKKAIKEPLTVVDVRMALTNLQTRKDAIAAKKILSGFGATTLAGLPEDKYAEVIAAANAA